MKHAKKIEKIKKVKKIKKLKPIKPIKGKPLLDKNKITSSKIEKIFGVFLKRLGIEIEEQFQIGYKFYDFKVKGKNILIEFDGDFYHCNPEVFKEGPETKMQALNIKNDLYKEKLAKANGYKLLRIWESDFKKKPKEVEKYILKECNE